MAAKTVEEIKAEIKSLVKSQGNQGAMLIGVIMDDIVELAGEGGGGGTVLPTIYLKNPAGAGDTITVDTTEDTKAIYDAAVANGVVVFNVSFKNDELGGSASELVTAVPPIARALIFNGSVVSTIIMTVGASPTQITSMTLLLSFAANGAISVSNTTNKYTIPA